MIRDLLCLVLIRLPIFLLALFAVAVCAAVMWVYDRIPPDWLEG